MRTETPIPYESPEDRWAAVLSRDRGADGAFLYAVGTTGVFCRPSCPSRRPLRKNVVFFETEEAAARAGYRPCRRCAPGRPDPRRERDSLLVRACRLLEREERLGNRELARCLGLNTFTLERLFKRQMGVTPQAYRRRVLAERARIGIPAAASVSAAAYAAGYSSSSRFYEGIGKELGMAPRQARGGGRGACVRYALRRSSLGTVLIAWTERGVCDVRFGDSEEEVVRGIEARYKEATLSRGEVPAFVREAVELVERPRQSEIPLDIQGTAFQERVWDALRRILPGETRSYAEVAAAIGAENSARAVAGACAANHLAVLIPCHRVVRRGGKLSGYRWGVERKRELLRREAAADPPP
ncbi:MAG TPA: bifunctional DNA-binding transcriptional regulator/O6-methylguanine-DNA methyltransferase Ada [Anaeromyxobacter sp.]|nr:bifunctional DNA-binding transcriptional regulator/O6-methylguanine-DNA methyltransferase Ada [Anaeromyxobacter sp.]